MAMNKVEVFLPQHLATVTKESFSKENFMAKELRHGLMARNTQDNTLMDQGMVMEF